MASIKTNKPVNLKHLFDALGLNADVSTNGVPLDAEVEKEITVTTKGDGTSCMQGELEAAVNSAVAAEASRRQAETDKKAKIAALQKKLGLSDEEMSLLRGT